MDRAHLFRRLFHFCAPLILLYYIVPDIFLWLPKFYWVLIVLSVILIIEAVRLGAGRVFFGLREYEKGQLSAYAWAGIGITLGFAFFQPMFVACVVFGIGWVDPLIGEMRRQRKMRYYPHLPLLIYFLIVIGCLTALSNINLLTILILGAVASASAIAIENPRLPADDDFLMQIVPLIVLTAFYEWVKIIGLS